MFINHIIPLQKGIPFDTLSYFSIEELKIGTVVKIKIGNSKRFGLVYQSISIIEERTSLRNQPFKLKKIDEVLFYHPEIKSLILALKETSDLTLAPLGAIASSSISGRFLELIIKEINSTKNNFKVNKNEFAYNKKVLNENTKERYNFYRELVRKSLARNESVLFIVPTLEDIENLTRVIKKGIEKKIVILHSKLTNNNLSSSIKKILNGNENIIIISTPKYSFFPRSDLKNIILEKESSVFYESNDRYNVDIKIFLEKYAIHSNKTLFFADNLVKFASLTKENLKKFSSITFKDRFEILPLIINKNEILPSKARELISLAIAKKNNIFIFSHKKGLAPLSRCKDCGEVVNCPNCDIPLVLKNIKNENKQTPTLMFICNRCDYSTSANYNCRKCTSWNIVSNQIGIESIVKEVENIIENKAEIITLENIKKTATKDPKKKFSSDKSKIYIGTEHLFSYCENIDFTIIPFFDRLMTTPSFETVEKILRMILSADEWTNKKIFVFSKNQNEFFEKFTKGTIHHLIIEDLEIREKLLFPPFGTFLKISLLVPIGLASKKIEDYENIFENLNINTISLNPRRQSVLSNNVIKSWILQTNDSWILESGDLLLQKLKSIYPQVWIERNPHYFS